MTCTNRIRTTAGRTLALLALLALAGCGSDDPTGPGGGPTGGITMSETTLDFGAVGAYHTGQRTVTITADADNAEDVSGTVAMAEAGPFSVSEGGGDYTLAPGETHEFTVRFYPRQSGQVFEGTVQTGTATVSCRGFGSSVPFYAFIPTGTSRGRIITNFGRFADTNVAVLYGSGRSYGESADWLTCASSGKWIFDGKATSESKVGFTFNVPTGVNEVLISLDMEAESDCVQVLIEMDNEEAVYNNMAGCGIREFELAVEPGIKTIYVGTDNALCGGDIEVASVGFRFRGAWVREGEWVD